MSLDLQQMFDIGCKGVIAQGTGSIDPDDNMCLYRGPNGTKCALGFCIADLSYDPGMEGMTITALGRRLGWTADANTLAAFQLCHDNAAADEGNFVTNFKDNARVFAGTHNLDTKVLDHDPA